MSKKITLVLLSIFISIFSYAQVWEEISKIVASVGGANDYFGYSIDISGDYAILGAYLDAPINAPNNVSIMAGSAFILRNTNGNWQVVQKAEWNKHAVSSPIINLK